MKTIWSLLLLFFVPLCSIDPILGEQQEEEEEEQFNEMDYYFYSEEPDASPIVEYMAPHEDWNETCPDFIYEPKKVPGIRIVEFYAHWCPHCQHFRNNYIQFARQTKQLIKQYAPQVRMNMYAVSCVPWKPVCNDWGVSAYPAVFIFEDGSVNGTKLNHFDIHPFMILSLLGIEVDDLTSKEEKGATTNALRSGNSDNEKPDSASHHFLPRTKLEIYNDAHLSFDFAMRNAIFVDQETLTNETADVFVEWIEQLHAALPPTWKLKNLLTEIGVNMDRILKSEATLIEIVDRYPPNAKTWSHSCTRGDKYAGYTCGLWELFHIMSVGLVEWNVFSNGDDWYYFRPSHSAKVIRNYVEHFFGCEVCRVNFLHAFDECEYDRCNRLIHDIGELSDWKEVPLWLYETHNGVNRRLLRERAERENRVPTKEEDIAVQWPPQHECPDCWHADGRWDQDNVYNYLRLTYWPEDELNFEIRRMLAASRLADDGNAENSESAGFWKRVLLALSCSSILLPGTLWYLKRRRLRRTGHHKKVDGYY